MTCQHLLRGLHPHEVELRDLLDVVEHLRELLAEAPDLLLGQLEAGKAGDVQHLVAREGHGVGV